MKPLHFHPTKKELNILAILVFVIICALASCSKSNQAPTPPASTKTSVIFYSTRKGADVDGVTLSINGKVVGGLVYSAQVPDCSQGAQFAETSLAPGSYVVSYSPYNSGGVASKTVSINVSKSSTCQTFDLN